MSGCCAVPDAFFRKLYRRNPLLTAIGWLHVAALIVTVLLAVFDDRQVMGINTWIKPMKFMFSLTIYIWTIAWIGAYVDRPRWRMKTIGVIIAIIIVIESACILIQAGRGTTSHYNIATDFDAAIFQTMGAMIAIDMLVGVFILLMFAKPSTTLKPMYLWGIRLGLATFLVGGWIGSVMISNNAHTVGAPDGGPGLPVLNWSTVAGDLRIAHGLALHSLQAFPFIAFVISESKRVSTHSQKWMIFSLFVAVYFATIYGTYIQALSGKPLL